MARKGKGGRGRGEGRINPAIRRQLGAFGLSTDALKPGSEVPEAARSTVERFRRRMGTQSPQPTTTPRRPSTRAPQPSVLSSWLGKRSPTETLSRRRPTIRQRNISGTTPSGGIFMS